MSIPKGRAAKTRERILETAAGLFCEHGVDGLSALDIATALGMSPGHLYYHFKGKEQIIAALLERHLNELSQIMEASREAKDLRSVWTHVHILLEEIHDARFLYWSLHALTVQNETLATKLRKLMFDLRHSLRQMLEALTRTGTLPHKEGLIAVLAEQSLLGLLFRLNQQALESPSKPGRAQVADAALFVMTLIAAHAVGDEPMSDGKPAKLK